MSASTKTAPRGAAAAQELQDYFDRFARALGAGDGRLIATMWETPALVLGDFGVHAVGSLKEVAEFFSGAKEQYNAHGITEARAEIADVQWPTDKMAIVRVRWPYIGAEGREIGEESSTYVLRREEGGELKMRAVVMHGEKNRPSA